MSTRSKSSILKRNCKSKTTKLGIEQLESRLMNSVDALESNLQLLASPGLFGSTQIVANSPPSVASPLRLSSGTTVTGKTASLTVLGADNAGESTLKYQWQLAETPTGGTVSFVANKSNAAKNNILTFNKPGLYEVSVTILDAQGLSAKTSLQFNVEQTLTSIEVKTSDGKKLTPGTILASGDISRRLTFRGLDQFGAEMASQPTVDWQTVAAPAGGTATLVKDGNSLFASFNRSGNFVLRAQSGSVATNVSMNVTQSLTYIDLTSPLGVVMDPTEVTGVTTKSQKFVVRGFDQFGIAMTDMPRVTWVATSAPSGGALSASLTDRVTILTFSRLGTYGVRVQSGSSSFHFSVNVIPTLTSIAIRNGEGRVVALDGSISVAGYSSRLSAVGLDQYGKALVVQPDMVWQASSVIPGATATLESTADSVIATFNRAGSYVVRAESGAMRVNVSISVAQTLTSISLLETDGSIVDPNTSIDVEGASHRLTVRAFDQFGNAIATTTKVSWSTVSSPTGGAATVSQNSDNATVSFTRVGSYKLKAQVGKAMYYVSFEVSRTLTSIVAVLANNRPVNGDSSISVSGHDLQLTARGYDQFGQTMLTQPDFVWTTLTAPVGTSATLNQIGVEAAIAFNRAGVYTVRVTAGKVSRKVTINVLQTVTSMSVSPGTSSVQTNASLQFRYQTLDQFGQSIANQPSAIWTTTGGTITSSGLLNSGTRTGTFAVTARVGTKSGTASFEVTAPTPAPTPPPAPTPTPPPPPPPPPAPQGPLHNEAIASLVSSLYSDNALSRTEMIQVLKIAGTDGVVDATELADLRYISSNGSIYAMPAYVRELAKDVVNSNPANLKFKGQTAGNLAAGSSATLLNNLVDKWFLGADEPVLTSSGLSYQTVVGNLFNGTPSRNDGKQGQLGDCYFIAALSAIADRSPDAVRNLFIDNSDGTYSVRFYAQAGQADYVTVNRRLPTNSGGRLEYSGYGFSIASTATTVWIALAEKAYAQWNETGNEGRDGTNRYSAIEGGWMSNVNAQVLGYNSSNYAFSTTPKASLVSAIAAGRSVTLGTKSGVGDGLVGSHAYTVSGYNEVTDTFTLYNPWGTSHPSPLSWAQLQANCSMFTVTDPSGYAANNLAAVRASISDTFVGNWTTVVVVPAGAAVVVVHETEVMEMGEPIRSILGSSFEEESSRTKLDFAVGPEKIFNEIPESDEVKVSPSLTAILVDLAICDLNLSVL